jgi:hypothetical protein
MYNHKSNTRSALASLVLSVAVTNFPLFLPNVESGFVRMLFSTGLRSGFYPYAYIPLLTVVALSIANLHELKELFLNAFETGIASRLRFILNPQWPTGKSAAVAGDLLELLSWVAPLLLLAVVYFTVLLFEFTSSLDAKGKNRLAASTQKGASAELSARLSPVPRA